MIKSIKTELKKAFTDSGIWIAILSIFAINLLNLLDEISIHPTHDSGFVLYFWVYRYGLGGFSRLLLLFSSLPYAVRSCNERADGSIKDYMIREKFYPYVTGKIVTTIVTGILACFIAYVLLLAALSCKYDMFPPEQDYEYCANLVDIHMFQGLAMDHRVLFFFADIVPEILIFTFLSMVSLLISAYTKNKYVVMTSPLLVYYGWNYITGTFGLPEIFQWPLKLRFGFQFFSDDLSNLAFNCIYFFAGMCALGFVYCRKMKEVKENV